jgi:hypothetical protein
MLCGELNAPRTCRRSFNFNQDLDFEVILRMPVEFQAAAILGSVKNLEFQQNSDIKTINGNSYRNIELKFSSQTLQKVLFSNFVPHPMDTSDYADYESDAINFWVLGKRSSQVGSLGRCSSTPFITVLSNSVYQSLPRWNSITSSIEVDLQAPHYSVGGDLQKGYFEATVSKAMGKCLWGIDLSKKSEAKMSISYSGSSGPEVQTVTGRFDGENYILFSANFHYSSPTVSLILQDSSPVVAPTQTPVPLLKNIAITCYKGKLKKVVKGSNPVCPVGYKKNN